MDELIRHYTPFDNSNLDAIVPIVRAEYFTRHMFTVSEMVLVTVTYVIHNSFWKAYDYYLLKWFLNYIV